MKARLAHHWDTLLSGLWFVPSLMALLAVALAFLTLHLDRSLPPDWIASLAWVWIGGPDGAYALLSALAGSMITVAGVVFSITIVALSLASNQYGPRLLRNFMRDRVNQLVLSIFVGAFAYSTAGLYTVGVKHAGEQAFVPRLAVSGSLALALASVGVLIYFIHHRPTRSRSTRS